MSFCLKSWLTGYALGLSGKPLPLSGGEPVAYLYNGVRLPKLPEWDKEKYPNAMITDGIHTTVTGIGVATVLNLGTFHYEWNQYGRYQFNMKDCALYKLIDNKWVLSYEGDRNLILNPDEERTTDYVLWTDTDIVSSTGSVWLAASEPIPVYE